MGRNTLKATFFFFYHGEPNLWSPIVVLLSPFREKGRTEIPKQSYPFPSMRIQLCHQSICCIQQGGRNPIDLERSFVLLPRGKPTVLGTDLLGLYQRYGRCMFELTQKDRLGMKGGEVLLPLLLPHQVLPLSIPSHSLPRCPVQST